MTGNFRLNNNYLLFISIICLLLFSYEVAFKRTIEAWQLNEKLRAQVDNTSLNEQPAYLERQEKALSAIISAYKIDTVNYRNNIVTQVSEMGDKEHVRIVEVPKQANLSTNQYLVQKIDLKGDFFALLKTLHRLQQTNGIGYVRSILLKKNATPGQEKDKEVVLEMFVEVIK